MAQTDSTRELPELTPRRSITFRSMLLGSLFVVLVSVLAPYNDYVVSNSYLVGSYFPPVLVGVFFLLMVLVNAPLNRWAPRWAFSSGELAIMMIMMLVACSLPGQGMMRTFLPTLVWPFHLGQVNHQFWEAFVALDLPEWLFPVERIEDGRLDRIVLDFYGRTEPGAPLPLGAWVIPLSAWAVFLFAMFATLLALANLLRRQWAVNERLAFPLVQLKMSLIEAPPPGRMLNRLFGSRAFWIAAAAVFAAQSMVVMHSYFPRYVPELTLSFDLRDVMVNEPWVYLSQYVKMSTIYFTFIGVTYFIQSRVAFSLWSIMLIQQLISMLVAQQGGEISQGALFDQMVGASFAFLAGVFWIGRHHWGLVLRQAVRGERPGEEGGEYGSYRASLVVVIVGIGIMAGWLMFMGVQAWVAVVLVGFLLAGHLIIARIVAETGIPFMRAYTTPQLVLHQLSPSLYTGQDVYFTSFVYLNGTLASRESLMTFVMHGMGVNEQASEPTPRQRRGVLAIILWALVLGFVTTSTASLYYYYTYATPITPGAAEAVLNPGGLESWPRHEANRLAQHAADRFPPTPHNAWLHFGIGAGITTALQAGALRFSGWPFLPVGYLVSATWYIYIAWFSILLGWLAKTLILKYGGSELYQKGRPFFVGITFGEALAMGFWLLVTLVLASQGYEYQVVRFLPQ
jgi:hypothetical protein